MCSISLYVAASDDVVRYLERSVIGVGRHMKGEKLLFPAAKNKINFIHVLSLTARSLSRTKAATIYKGSTLSFCLLEDVGTYPTQEAMCSSLLPVGCVWGKSMHGALI